MDFQRPQYFVRRYPFLYNRGDCRVRAPVSALPSRTRNGEEVMRVLEIFAETARDECATAMVGLYVIMTVCRIPRERSKLFVSVKAKLALTKTVVSFAEFPKYGCLNQRFMNARNLLTKR
jgi:hypothetical protein